MKHLQAEQKQYHNVCTVQVSYIHLQPVLANLIQPMPEAEDQCTGHFKPRNTQAQYVVSLIATRGLTAPMLPVVNSLTCVQPVQVDTHRAALLKPLNEAGHMDSKNLIIAFVILAVVS